MKTSYIFTFALLYIVLFAGISFSQNAVSPDIQSQPQAQESQNRLNDDEDIILSGVVVNFDTTRQEAIIRADNFGQDFKLVAPTAQAFTNLTEGERIQIISVEETSSPQQ